MAEVRSEKKKETRSTSREEMAAVTTTVMFPRDLLQGFMSSSTAAAPDAAAEPKFQNEYFYGPDDESDNEDIELNLGLSLGGRFGVDKTSKKLKRSSSIVGTMPILREATEESVTASPSVPFLTRTTSLPVESEEEWRKRKEMQMIRRMEAKRRRSEKQQRNSRIGGSGCSKVEASLEEAGGCTASFGLDRRGGFLERGVGSRQGSVDSDIGGGGGSCSSVSEMESKPLQGGSNSCGEIRSPASSHLSPEGNNQEDKAGGSGTKTNETGPHNSRSDVDNPLIRRHNSVEKGGKETTIGDMPCVFAKGEGPNGRRVEGILYRYGKGEEVRIMCVCHGSFHSPAEFVKHAGGGDVDHPLRHIVVNTSSSASSLL